MKGNFNIEIIEHNSRHIHFTDIQKILSCCGYYKFIDTDNNVMCEYKKDIEKIIVQAIDYD